MPGQRVCSKHGGKAPNAVAMGQERVALTNATQALRSLGEKVEPWERVDPREALLDIVHQAFTVKNAMQFLLNDSSEADFGAIGTMVEIDGGEGVGPIMVPHKGGVKAERRLKLFNDAMDRCARVSKLALDAGIEERMVKLAERQSETIADVIRAAVSELPEELKIVVIQKAAAELRFRSAQPVEQVVTRAVSASRA